MDNVIICSHCQTEILQSYCPNCGQKYINRKISLRSMIADFWDSLLSLDKSFWLNFKLLILNPKFFITNYWNGFRSFYFSPNKTIIIAALFLGLNFLLFKNNFFGFKISAENLSAQLGFIIFIVPLLTISSYLAYFKFRRNLIEHLVLNMYNLGIWLIIFLIFSIIVNYLELANLRYIFLILFVLSIFIWNARVFDLKLFTRIAFVFLNFIIFFLIISGIIFLAIHSKKT